MATGSLASRSDMLWRMSEWDDVTTLESVAALRLRVAELEAQLAATEAGARVREGIIASQMDRLRQLEDSLEAERALLASVVEEKNALVEALERKNSK